MFVFHKDREYLQNAYKKYLIDKALKEKLKEKSL
jgi:hypothetical protein